MNRNMPLTGPSHGGSAVYVAMARPALPLWQHIAFGGPKNRHHGIGIDVAHNVAVVVETDNYPSLRMQQYNNIIYPTNPNHPPPPPPPTPFTGSASKGRA
jgi:hypothetical protein